MQRYTALWLFPVLSLVLVVFMTIRSAQVVDAPADEQVVSAADVAAFNEQHANLKTTLSKSVDARVQLERHVKALHDELSELRASRTAIVAEAKLWRDSYDILANRFDELVAATRAEDGLAETLGRPKPVAASFAAAPEVERVPRPLGAVIVR